MLNATSRPHQREHPISVFLWPGQGLQHKNMQNTTDRETACKRSLPGRRALEKGHSRAKSKSKGNENELMPIPAGCGGECAPGRSTVKI